MFHTINGQQFIFGKSMLIFRGLAPCKVQLLLTDIMPTWTMVVIAEMNVVHFVTVRYPIYSIECRPWMNATLEWTPPSNECRTVEGSEWNKRHSQMNAVANVRIWICTCALVIEIQWQRTAMRALASVAIDHEEVYLLHRCRLCISCIHLWDHWRKETRKRIGGDVCIALL